MRFGGQVTRVGLEVWQIGLERPHCCSELEHAWAGVVQVKAQEWK